MRYMLMLVLLGGMSFGIQADELHVVLNGKAIHLDSGNYNEDNWGLGLNYDYSPRNNWVNFINSSYFKDSNNQTSKYFGGGIKRRYELDSDPDGWRADIGVIAFLMTRYDYNDNDPFFGALPFVSISKGIFTLNTTYIPAVSPKHTDLIFFQAMIRIAEF